MAQMATDLKFPIDSVDDRIKLFKQIMKIHHLTILSRVSSLAFLSVT